MSDSDQDELRRRAKVATAALRLNRNSRNISSSSSSDSEIGDGGEKSRDAIRLNYELEIESAGRGGFDSPPPSPGLSRTSAAVPVAAAAAAAVTAAAATTSQQWKQETFERRQRLNKYPSENNLSSHLENEESTASSRRKNLSDRLKAHKTVDLYNFHNTQLVIQDNGNLAKSDPSPTRADDEHHVAQPDVQQEDDDSEKCTVSPEEANATSKEMHTDTHLKCTKNAANISKIKRFNSENNLYIKKNSIAYSLNGKKEDRSDDEADKDEEKAKVCDLQLVSLSIEEKKKV